MVKYLNAKKNYGKKKKERNLCQYQRMKCKNGIRGRRKK